MQAQTLQNVVLFGSFQPTSVLQKAGPNIYGVKSLANQDGTLSVTGDMNSVYVNTAVPANQHTLLAQPNAAFFPIVLSRNPSDAWLLHPNLVQFMQLARVTGDFDAAADFPFLHLAPNSTYKVEVSVAVDVGLYPDNYTSNAHYIVLDLVHDDESLLSATTMVWNPSQSPATRSINMSGTVKNGTPSTMNVVLKFATTVSVCSVVPRFVKLTQIFNDY